MNDETERGGRVSDQTSSETTARKLHRATETRGLKSESLSVMQTASRPSSSNENKEEFPPISGRHSAPCSCQKRRSNHRGSTRRKQGPQ